MRTLPVSLGVQNYSAPAFKGGEKSEPQKNEYENPIDKDHEVFLAGLGTAWSSIVLGFLSAAMTAALRDAPQGALNSLSGWKVPGAIGATIAVLSFAFNLPKRLYNARVNANFHEAEVESYNHRKGAEIGISKEHGKRVKNPGEYGVDFEVNLKDNFMLNSKNNFGIVNASV